ncbi:MAG: DUF3795 domain-containing protein, partial [Candidatus Bipolaricaulota bacterium]|nr:DUF3795 domain-containing protein [Candidatus Bipolaricaulota bacterium]
GETMLGYCGMNCTACSSYTTTVTADKELLAKAAASLASANGSPAWVCLGCTPANQQFLAKYCATCKIRDCAIEKKVQNCAACDDYESCTPLHDFFKGESAEAIGKRMDWLRARFQASRNERASTTAG